MTLKGVLCSNRPRTHVNADMKTTKAETSIHMLECSSLIDNNSLQLHVIAAKHERYKYIIAS